MRHGRGSLEFWWPSNKKHCGLAEGADRSGWNKKIVGDDETLRRGDPAGIRTPDPLLKRQLLYRLSYRIVAHMKSPEGENWLGRLDSNQRVRESKSLALPLGDAPMWKENRESGCPDSLFFLGWVMGLEPTTPGTTIQCSAIELHPPHTEIWHMPLTAPERKWYARRDSNPWPTA